jgi:hypothetical protein
MWYVSPHEMTDRIESLVGSGCFGVPCGNKASSYFEHQVGEAVGEVGISLAQQGFFSHPNKMESTKQDDSLDILFAAPTSVLAHVIARMILMYPCSTQRFIITSPCIRTHCYRAIQYILDVAMQKQLEKCRLDQVSLDRIRFIGLEIACLDYTQSGGQEDDEELRQIIESSDDTRPAKLLELEYMWYRMSQFRSWMLQPNSTEGVNLNTSLVSFPSWFGLETEPLQSFLRHVLLWIPGRTKLNHVVSRVLTSLEKSEPIVHGWDSPVVITQDFPVKQDAGETRREHLLEEFGTRKVSKAVARARTGHNKTRHEPSATIISPGTPAATCHQIKDHQAAESVEFLMVQIKMLDDAIFDAHNVDLKSRCLVRRATWTEAVPTLTAISNGGMGGHWSNEHASVLDVAESLKHNTYFRHVDMWQWLPHLFYNINTTLCEAIHDIDCDLDDGRIQDPAAFKRQTLMKIMDSLLESPQLKEGEEEEEYDAESLREDYLDTLRAFSGAIIQQYSKVQ